MLAELDVMRLEVEVRLADDALHAMAKELADNRDRTATTPGLLRTRRARVQALERQIRTVRGRLLSKREELQEKREGLERRRAEVVDYDGVGRGARMYRLHSAQHHLDCSERRFARLARSQLELPVLVTRRDGRRWWWYLDRFWWDDERLSARDIEALVLEGDLGTRKRAAELARVRAAVLGEELAPEPEESLSPIVRFAVWCRDRGRCVDCRTSETLGYDQIVPFSKGGSRWVANVELRCAPCRERRRRNETRKRVSRARIEAMPYRRAPTGAPARRRRRERGGGGRLSAGRSRVTVHMLSIGPVVGYAGTATPGGLDTSPPLERPGRISPVRVTLADCVRSTFEVPGRPGVPCRRAPCDAVTPGPATSGETAPPALVRFLE